MGKTADLGLLALVRCIRHLSAHGIPHMAHPELEDELLLNGEWICPYCGETIGIPKTEVEK